MIAVAACSETSGPGVASAIQLFPLEVPSLVKGYPLTDTLGRPDSLHAVAYDSHGDPIASAPIRYFVIDTFKKIQVDSIRGTVMAVDTGSSRVIAEVGGLQAQPLPITVVLAPDSAFALDSTTDSLTYTFNGRDTAKALRIAVTHATFAVPSYRVEYQVTYPPGFTNTDSSLVLVVNASNQPSLVDTTDATGTGTRSLLITPRTDTITDSVALTVAAFLPDHTPVRGSPVHYLIHVKIR